MQKYVILSYFIFGFYPGWASGKYYQVFFIRKESESLQSVTYQHCHRFPSEANSRVIFDESAAKIKDLHIDLSRKGIKKNREKG